MKGMAMKNVFLKMALILTLLLASALYSQSNITTTENTGGGENKKQEYESQFNNAQSLFAVGSAMTVVGLLAVTVSGNADIVAPIGGTLFGIGHAGLIMTGISISKMKRIVIEMNGKDEFSWAPKSGWIYYGVGWGAIAAGISVMIIGMQKDISPMVIGGIAGLGLGEIMHITSWVKFTQGKKYWKSNFDQISFSPNIYFDENKHCMVGCILQYNF